MACLQDHGHGFDYMPRSPVDDLFDEHPLSYSFLPPSLGSPSSSYLSVPPLYSHLSAPDLRRLSRVSSHSSLGTLYPDKCSPEHTLKHEPSSLQFGTISTISQDAPSCTFDQRDWFGQFKGDFDVSDDPPSQDALRQSWNVPVYDAAGNYRSFKSLYYPGDVLGKRQLFVFIRHFYCGACKAYVKALARTFRSMRSIATSIIIIGCGSPKLIRQYKATTSCPFPIFADPSRRLYKILGMSLTLDVIGHRRPQYMGNISAAKWLVEQFKATLRTRGRKLFMAGNLLQIGGEFLLERGEVVWCHRMKNMRGHAEVDVIKRVLEIDAAVERRF